MTKKYVIYKEVTGSSSGVVSNVIHNPYPEQYVPNGVFTESAIPVVEMLPLNINANLMINLEDNTLYLDYQEAVTVEKEVLDLKTENAALYEAMGNLLIESAADKATIMGLEETMGNLLLEVAALKGGAA
ncbi:hypothetical protein [Paenibacillus sp. PDC88]|uniref:hypothetical protein n=1 Tax=Paenibacillus sp. PDC88 TaxID=1884375 RepID=UPI00089AC1D3|nr:hypothetical protein [Paenibacillus sp. PDC88]SDW30554.1 hypothetical protein SAMN05518848_101947 [Paenibacillus sp. PDC88]